jgi:hypothetical protein
MASNEMSSTVRSDSALLWRRARVRVWQIMSREWSPRGGRPPPEGANVGYPLTRDTVDPRGPKGREQ